MFSFNGKKAILLLLIKSLPSLWSLYALPGGFFVFPWWNFFVTFFEIRYMRILSSLYVEGQAWSIYDFVFIFTGAVNQLWSLFLLWGKQILSASFYSLERCGVHLNSLRHGWRIKRLAWTRWDNKIRNKWTHFFYEQPKSFSFIGGEPGASPGLGSWYMEKSLPHILQKLRLNPAPLRGYYARAQQEADSADTPTEIKSMTGECRFRMHKILMVRWAPKIWGWLQNSQRDRSSGIWVDWNFDLC